MELQVAHNTHNELCNLRMHSTPPVFSWSAEANARASNTLRSHADNTINSLCFDVCWQDAKTGDISAGMEYVRVGWERLGVLSDTHWPLVWLVYRTSQIKCDFSLSAFCNLAGSFATFFSPRSLAFPPSSANKRTNSKNKFSLRFLDCISIPPRKLIGIPGYEFAFIFYSIPACRIWFRCLCLYENLLIHTHKHSTMYRFSCFCAGAMDETKKKPIRIFPLLFFI